MKAVSILGAGWLGLALGRALAAEGFLVRGSTTRKSRYPELLAAGIEPFLIDLGMGNLEDVKFDSDFFRSDILIIAVPPRMKSDGGKRYLTQMERVADGLRVSSVAGLLFISSTSVYTSSGVVKETDANPQHPLVFAENLFLDALGAKATIVRFAGLIGPGRHPAMFFSGKGHVPAPQAPVNMIHRDDCIRLITHIIERDAWGEIFNACADEHPSRIDFYTYAANSAGVPAPTFADDENSGKVVDCSKLQRTLGFTFMNLLKGVDQITV